MADRAEIRRQLQEYNERNLIDLFIVESDVMLDALDFANKLSGFNSNVLILGDSGVGKEALAKYIQCQSHMCHQHRHPKEDRAEGIP